MKLVAQMVCKNEADRFLEPVLKHLTSIVDEVVFTDDCSTDNSVEIAASYGAHTYKMDESTFATNEGLLRNTAWNNLSNHASPGDWVLAIDADEELWSSRPDNDIRKLMAQDSFDVINIRFFHMWNETHYRNDKLWTPNNSTRMFRFFYGGQFLDRKLACGSEPTYVQTLMRRGRYMADSGLIMKHLGYVRDEDKKMKYDRYMALDHGDFHQLSHIESIIDPEPELIEWKYGQD